MKKIVLLLIVLLVISVGAHAGTDKVLKSMKWLGQAAVMIDHGGKTYYIDPFKLSTDKKADFILITHGHGDHLSVADLKKITTDKTIIAVPDNCVEKLKGMKFAKVVKVRPGAKFKMCHVKVEAVHAYNIEKVKYHPKSNEWVGYVLNIDGTKVYHAGDTELIPEMGSIDCDIALLPLGQTYTMNSVEDAAKAAEDVKAEVAIPIHYGMYEGKAEDAQKFKKLLEGKIKVVILKY